MPTSALQRTADPLAKRAVPVNLLRRRRRSLSLGRYASMKGATVKEELHPRCVIQENAKRLAELHSRVHETFKRRDTGPEVRAEWAQACSDFHTQYDALAFPGGYNVALQKIQDGDSRALEDALAFLEVHPYFFRSQYIRTKLTRLLKHAQLTTRQAERFSQSLGCRQTEEESQEGTCLK